MTELHTGLESQLLCGNVAAPKGTGQCMVPPPTMYGTLDAIGSMALMNESHTCSVMHHNKVVYSNVTSTLSQPL